jgi:hypothetical protein
VYPRPHIPTPVAMATPRQQSMPGLGKHGVWTLVVNLEHHRKGQFRCVAIWVPRTNFPFSWKGVMEGKARNTDVSHVNADRFQAEAPLATDALRKLRCSNISVRAVVFGKLSCEGSKTTDTEESGREESNPREDPNSACTEDWKMALKQGHYPFRILLAWGGGCALRLPESCLPDCNENPTLPFPCRRAQGLYRCRFPSFILI